MPEAKCFGYVQTYDRKPRRRLWELLKSQGLQDHQQVVFLSDGGEDVRGVQAYLQPGSEHWINWFHITMRLTVLQQQTKSLRCEVGWDAVAEGISKQIESIKHLLWHGKAVFQEWFPGSTQKLPEPPPALCCSHRAARGR